MMSEQPTEAEIEAMLAETLDDDVPLSTRTLRARPDDE